MKYTSLLWLSVAIYQMLIELNYCELPNGCRVHLDTKIICDSVNIDQVLPFIPSNTSRLEIQYSKGNNLTFPFASHFPSLNSLLLRDGQLEIIQVDSLSGLSNLTSLSLESNHLSHLQKDTFMGLPNLGILNLRNNKFVFLDDIIPALIPIKNLGYLDLSYNLIKSISVKEIQNLYDLTTEILDLSGCLLNNADPSVIRYWKIHELYISDNPMDTECFKNITLGIQNSTVYKLVALKLSSVTYMYVRDPFELLYDSKIQDLSIGDNDFSFALDFQSFLSLRKLLIVNSHISELNIGALFSLPYLERLELIKNNIDRIKVNILTDWPTESTLETLHMNGNKFSYFDKMTFAGGIFSSLSRLSNLNIELTWFGDTITAKTFSGLYNLSTLRLDECSLEQIEDTAFQDLGSLKVLELSGNRLSSLRKEMFIGLHNLTWLNLGNNLLTFLNESSPFAHLRRLEILILEHNNIKYLLPSHFGHLTKVEVIRINYNSIAPWNVSVIPRNGRFYNMHLRSNKLNTVTPVMMQDFDQLQYVDLADNDFDCRDCNMRQFQQWVLSTNVTLEGLESHPEEYTCQSPHSLKDVYIKTVVLDMEHCAPDQDFTIVTAVTLPCTLVMIIAMVIAFFKLRWHFRYCCYLLRLRVKRFREIQDSICYQYDAFVSYDPADSNWIIDELLAALETGDSHIKFCLYDRDCMAGNDVTEQIFEVIQKCRKTLLVLSDSYAKNQWCMFELQMAQHSLFEKKRDSLILIRLHPIEEELISANLAYLITTRTYIVWTDHPMGQRLFWKRLLTALAKPDTLQMSRIV